MEFYNFKEVKTRKEHKCFLCKINILVGDTVTYEVGKYDGEFFSRYSHNECIKIWVEENANNIYEWGEFMGGNSQEIKKHRMLIKNIYVVNRGKV